MRNLLILFLCFFTVGCLRATAQFMPLDRQHFADSLETQLKNSKATDSARARAALQLSVFWNADSVKAMSYLNRAKSFMDGGPYMQGIYQYFIGQFYFDRAPEKAEIAYMKAVSILNKSGLKTVSSYEIRVSAWANYAILQQIKGDDDRVIDIILNKQIPYAKLGGLNEHLATSYSDLGVLFSNLLEFEKAAEYHEMAVNMIDSISVTSILRVTIYMRAAEVYLTLNELGKASKLLQNLQELLHDFKESSPYVEYLIREGTYHRKIKQYGRSQKFLQEAFALAGKLKDGAAAENSRYQQAKTWLEQKEYAKAEQAMFTVVQHIHYPSPSNKRLYYDLLATINLGQGDMKNAYKWQKAYSTISDSLNESRLKEKMHLFEMRYRASENQREIATLKAEKTAVKLEASNNRLFMYVLGSALVVLAMLAVFLMTYYRNYRRLAMQKEINYQQQLREMEQQQDLQLTKAMLDGEEQERTRLAGDLHDGLGGLLAGAKIKFTGWAVNNLKGKNDADFQSAVMQLDHSASELRRIAHNLMPATLIKFGLETALRDLCDFHSSDGLKIDFQPIGIDYQMHLTLQTHIYRIIQELLSNAIRHSGAAHLLVQCSHQAGNFLITVEDDGHGFDQSKVQTGKGIGLANLKNRANFLKAKLEINSRPGEGTSVNIEFRDPDFI